MSSPLYEDFLQPSPGYNKRSSSVSADESPSKSPRRQASDAPSEVRLLSPASYHRLQNGRQWAGDSDDHTFDPDLSALTVTSSLPETPADVQVVEDLEYVCFGVVCFQGCVLNLLG